MSAFVVSEWTMHRCVFALDEYGSLCEQLDILGQRLFELNENAVAARYKTEPNRAQSEAYRFRPCGTPSVFQLLKSLECLHYQCSEDGIEGVLMERMERKMNELRGKIVARVVEYQLAGYDGPNERETPYEAMQKVTLDGKAL